jgi:hypothetical protein
VQGTGEKAQSTEHRAQGTEEEAQGTEHRAQSTGRRVKDLEMKGPQDNVLCITGDRLCITLKGS